jgi:hypothetical protein
MGTDKIINAVIRVLAIVGVIGFTAIVFPKILFYPHDGAVPFAFVCWGACFAFAWVAWLATEPRTNKSR